MTATRVIVVDDQKLVREGLASLLALLPEIEVAGTAADGAEALDLVDRVHPEVALMDLRMPRMDGVEATRRIRAAHPSTQVIILTTYDDDESILAALRAGARGYLTKDSGAEEIARAVALVRAGRAMMDPAVQARLVDRLQAEPERKLLPDDLTPREAEVLRLIAEGLSNAEIAGRLFVSEATVKTHINNVFSKIGVRDRAQAVRYAFAKRMVERPGE